MRHLFIITGGGKWGQSVGDSGLGERLRLALPGVAGGRFQLGKRSRTPKDTVPPCWQPGDAFRTSDFSFPCRNMRGKKKNLPGSPQSFPQVWGVRAPMWRQSLCALLFQGFPAKSAGSALSIKLYFEVYQVVSMLRCPKQRFGRCGTPQTPFDVVAIALFGAGARQRGRPGCGNIDPLGRGSQLRCEGAL